MVDTLISEHIDNILGQLTWTGPLDRWALLKRLLDAIEAQRLYLGAVDGTLRTDRDGVADSDAVPIVLGPVMRASIESMQAGGLRPYELVLRCEPAVWLPDGRLRIVDYDDTTGDEPNLWSPGEAILSSLDAPDMAEGLALWKLRQSPVSLFSIEITFWFEDEASLWIKSNCDLWRKRRLDGELNGAHGAANAQLLHHVLARLARATDARLELQES